VRVIISSQYKWQHRFADHTIVHMLLHFGEIFDFRLNLNPVEFAAFLALLLLSTFGTAFLGLLYAFSKEDKKKENTHKFHTLVTVVCFSFFISCFFIDLKKWWIYLIATILFTGLLVILKYFPVVGSALMPVVYWIQFCFLISLSIFFEQRSKNDNVLFVKVTEFVNWLYTLPIFIFFTCVLLWNENLSRALLGTWQVSSIIAFILPFTFVRFSFFTKQWAIFLVVSLICIITEAPVIFLAYRKQLHLSKEKPAII
jgi:hypothetical protein